MRQSNVVTGVAGLLVTVFLAVVYLVKNPMVVVR